MMEENEIRKCKVAFCKCGVRVIMMAALPWAETEKDIVKDFRNYAKEGRKIDYITTTEARELFGGCGTKPVKCWKEDQDALLATEGKQEGGGHE